MPIRTTPPSTPGLGAEIEQRHAVAEPLGLDGNLDDFGAGRSHRLHEPGEIGRHAREVVVRQHDAPAARMRHEIVEARARFDVDVLRAERQRVGEDAPSLFFRALEVAAFPLRTARDDDGTAPAGQRAGDVRVADRVEAELDQIGVGDLVAAAAQLGHGRRCHGYTEQWLRHQADTKKSLFTG